jgi:FkbM family methyltransferase
VREVLAQGGPKRVVDLGGNIGLFSRFITEVVEVSDLTTYEPDPANLALLKRNLAELPGGLTPTIVPVCAGVSDGSVRFETGSFGRSRVLGGDDADGGPKVSVLPCEDVLPRLMDADLIKIDIEGSEWEILADPRFRESPARAIVMEYHSWRCPGGDPRTTAERMFRDMGFNVRTEREHVHGFGELWAWR